MAFLCQKVEKMAKEHEKTVAFGMTKSDVAQTVEALLKYTDANNPKGSGSYENFLEIKNAGHKVLLAQEGYGKINS